MPHISARAIALRALTASTKRLRQIFLVANFAHLATGNWSVFNQSNESFIALLLFQRRLDELRETRYVSERPYRKYDSRVFERDLDDKSDAP